MYKNHFSVNKSKYVALFAPHRALDMRCTTSHQVLIKEVFARPGETVCLEGRKLVVEDERAHPLHTSVLSKDGDLLQIAWQGCHTLGPDEVFVAGEHPSSCDSRYFGPISTQDILFEIEPLWTLQAPRSVRPPSLQKQREQQAQQRHDTMQLWMEKERLRPQKRSTP